MSVVRCLRLAAAALALALSACGESDLEAAGNRRPVLPAGEVELNREAVAARKTVWVSKRPPAYSYRIETTCDCFLAGTYDVTVEGEAVLKVQSHQPDAEPYRLYSPPLVDSAFASLDEPLALADGGEISKGRSSARFDATYGYPISWTVIGSDGLPSHHAEISDFQVLDPSTLESLPQGLSVVVSNQSFDDPEVALTIKVGEGMVVQRSFAVEGQHTYVAYLLPLPPGEHTLTVTADSGTTAEHVMTLGPDRRFLYVGYWGGGKPFSIRESETPFGFG